MVYFGTNNTMAQRVVPAISLYEATLGGNNFLTLDTCKKIHSKNGINCLLAMRSLTKSIHWLTINVNQ